MLAAVGTGIAKGNAVSEAKAVSNFVTDSNSDDGIIKGLLNVGLL